MDAQKLLDRVQSLHARYALDFGGRPRITRNVALLQNLIEEGDGLYDELKAQGMNDQAAALQQSLDHYRQEKAEIDKAQAEGGPDAMACSDISEFVQLYAAQYSREFAGQNRATRDVFLLKEIIHDLERLGKRLNDLTDYHGSEVDTTRNLLDKSIELYKNEQTAIEAARTSGTLDQQAATFAQIANAQFAIYANHFAGKARLSRRPALLERVINALKDVLKHMETLQSQGLNNEDNTKNQQIVANNIAAYEQELEQIRASRQATDFVRLTQALGEAANEAFARFHNEFAGKLRSECDLAALAQVCDALFDALRQMDELDQVRDDDMNHRNRRLVLDRLRLYTNEYDQIVLAKNPQKNA